MIDKSCKKVLANGNEAVAWAALAARVDYFTHYPGSPVNLVEPALKNLSSKHNIDITFNDALNEHIAALAAAGVSYCGGRSMLVMKHVGMNIAADPLNYIGYTGVKGGMVIIVGTDPGANASTGEEDTHWYAIQMNFPLYEPTSVKEIFKYVSEAFDVSEKHQIPILVFLPVRLCYNSDLINVPEHIPQRNQDNSFYFEKDKAKYVNVGERNIRNHRLLLERIDNISEEIDNSKSFYNPEAKIGLITRGVTFGHTFESIEKLNISEKVHLLNMDMVFPLHRKTILDFFENKTEVIVIEDQDGFLENQIKMNFFNDIEGRILGKEYFPKYGEIQFGQVYTFLAEKFQIHLSNNDKLLSKEIPERLGTFCEGCPHRAAYFAINKALEGIDGIIGGDIGCSSLPPFLADWLLCMNAGIGISQGMSHVLKKQVVVSTGGEGSFFHTGIISLQNAVINNINLIHIVFDNKTVAMTGLQPSPTTHSKVNIKKLLEAIGVDRIIEVQAKKPWDLTKRLKKEIKQTGVRVIWIHGECVQTPGELTLLKRNILAPNIENQKCGSCTTCYDNFACPAINLNEENGSGFVINHDQCSRCGVCAEICPNDAIKASLTNTISGTVKHCLEFLQKKLS